MRLVSALSPIVTRCLAGDGGEGVAEKGVSSSVVVVERDGGEGRLVFAA